MVIVGTFFFSIFWGATMAYWSKNSPFTN